MQQLVIGLSCALTAGPGAAALVRFPEEMIDRRNGRRADGRCFAGALAASPERLCRVVVVARAGLLGSAGTSFRLAPGLFDRANNRAIAARLFRKVRSISLVVQLPRRSHKAEAGLDVVTG